MCLIAFRWQPDAGQPLIMAANRDEFHTRPTRALGWWRWPEGPLAGRDEQAGGTWMAAGRDARFAAITNFRDPDAGAGERSRGEIAPAWLGTESDIDAFAERLYRQRHAYAPFTVVFGHPGAARVVGTHAEPEPIAPGIHALSNHLLDTPWPKSIRAVRRLERWLDTPEDDIDGLLDLLDDRRPAVEEDLPDTGVDRVLKTLLSAPFIVSDRYGTRSSSALVVGETMTMAERTYDPSGRRTGERVFGWKRRY